MDELRNCQGTKGEIVEIKDLTTLLGKLFIVMYTGIKLLKVMIK